MSTETCSRSRGVRPDEEAGVKRCVERKSKVAAYQPQQNEKRRFVMPKLKVLSHH